MKQISYKVIWMLAVAGGVAALLLFNSCSSKGFRTYFEVAHMSNTPAGLAKHASPGAVRAAMGEPAWAETVKDANGTPILHVWHYRDDWHRGRGFGSWDVYFDKNEKYIGERLEVLSQETGAREILHLPKGDRVPGVE
jgi:hypothetical protein